MATSNRFWPFSLVVIGVVFTAWMVLTSPSDASRVLQSCDERPAYPGCVEVPVDCGPYPESVCNVTKTAVSHCDGCASADCHGSGRRSESGNSHPHCDHNTDCNRDTNCNGHSDANLNRSVCPANYARAHACSHCHAHLNRNCADDSAITFTFA